MLEFPQHKNHEIPLCIEETDYALPEKLNPSTRYAFFSTIATGGKSLIKSCVDLHLRRKVCYKTLRSEFLNNEIEKRRLLREARVSAMLQHPNTVPTYEIGRDNRGNYYFTMKLIHGYTLREILNYRERYDLSQLMDVIMQVARALSYAHTLGVVHRDIKPDNILVGLYGETLLLDWGLAKVWPKDKSLTTENEKEIDEVDTDPGMTGEGKLQGSVMYMSPEQIERDPNISFATDIYSLGAVLYETLTGETPFQGDVVRKLLDKIQQEKPSYPKSSTQIPLPKILTDLTMQCLEKDPKNRPQSADDMIHAIKEGI